ncbi:hypothetical protein QBC42DRAFT_260472 [Cladorrhinum samala]|uniref:Uncharacterized protein n=1 Tax=Cladorrhinum samala TaxID=585594 RepID=A0AAV9HY93_9PEZI|nr:hypothetical protein QBC42DRAFT_260472 [Cladorrhinum samala]
MEPVFIAQSLSPSALISQILHSHCAHPTTLLICGLTQADFLSALAQDLNASPASPCGTDLLLPPSLAQLSISRHIRTLFIPTVSHLRAFLSVFSIHDSRVPPPPFLPSPSKPPPLLVAYNFISSHRDTSEWSIQGISSTAAVLIEAAKRERLRAVVVDPTPVSLDEKIPVLSGSSKRMLGAAADGIAGWTGRTAELNKVVKRWLRVQETWGSESGPGEVGQHEVVKQKTWPCEKEKNHEVTSAVRQ